MNIQNMKKKTKNFDCCILGSPDTVSGSGTAMTPSGALHGTVLHGAASNSGALGVASPQEPTYVNL